MNILINKYKKINNKYIKYINNKLNVYSFSIAVTIRPKRATKAALVLSILLRNASFNCWVCSRNRLSLCSSILSIHSRRSCCDFLFARGKKSSISVCCSSSVFFYTYVWYMFLYNIHELDLDMLQPCRLLNAGLARQTSISVFGRYMAYISLDCRPNEQNIQLSVLFVVTYDQCD